MTNAQSVTPSSKPEESDSPRLAFPKSRRLLRSAEFRQVYDHGFRLPCRCFVAFCWKAPVGDGPKVGFTTPRALGKSVQRNRMKRRVREVVRLQLHQLSPHWRVVFNLRRLALDAPQSQIESEVGKVVRQCEAWH